MKKVAIILFTLIYSLFASYAFTIQVHVNEKNDLKAYIDSVCTTADSLYRAGNKMLSFECSKKVIDFYLTHKDQLIMNDEICRTIFDTYTSYVMSENPISLEERTHNLTQALNIIELNSNWIKSYPNKQRIINQYEIYIRYLIEIGRISDAQDINQNMLGFAEQHYRLGLTEVILSACSNNSLMGRFELNYPLYKQLYDKFDELDKLQQYKVLKELIQFEFKTHNYGEVINLATKHTRLIQWVNDEYKDAVLDIISLSFEKNAFGLEDAVSPEQYSDETDQAYMLGYDWTKTNNKVFFPRSIIYWAYYKYKWNDTKNDAISLFYELLDILQNKNIEEPLFDEYCEIEDAQQAIISIIVTQIIKASTPIDIDSFITKYDRVFNELIGSKEGEYYKVLIDALETAYIVCYGK